jgi:vacuolar iron transporter family protein
VLVAATPANWLFAAVAGGSLVFLALLGTIGAKAGGAQSFRPALRVTFWGAFAMALTAGIGSIFGKVI